MVEFVVEFWWKMFLTIFPSKRSSKISLQSSPEVRHQFRRKTLPTSLWKSLVLSIWLFWGGFRLSCFLVPFSLSIFQSLHTFLDIPCAMSTGNVQNVRKRHLGAPKPGCCKPACLQFLRRSALLRSFAPFCALLRSFADLRLRSFARICALFCVGLRPRLERPRLGTAESYESKIWLGPN